MLLKGLFGAFIQSLAETLRNPPVDLAIGDHGVDYRAAVVDGDVAQDLYLSGLRVDFGHTHTCVPNGQVKLGDRRTCSPPDQPAGGGQEGPEAPRPSRPPTDRVRRAP